MLFAFCLGSTASAATYDWTTAFSFDVFNTRTYSQPYQDLTISVTDNTDPTGWPSVSTTPAQNRLSYYGSGIGNANPGPALMRITKTDGSAFTPTGSLTLYYRTYYPEPNPPFTYQTSTASIRAYSGSTLTGTVNQSITGPGSFTITFSLLTGFSNITALEFDNGKQDLAIGPLTLGSSTSAPTVTTATQSGVTHNSATLGGNVTADGGASVTDRGIVWGTSANPTTGNNKVQIGSGTGVFSQLVTGLPPSTTIHVRAYATNSADTAYGNDISFATNPAPVAVSSLNTASASPTNATTVNWTLTFASAVTGLTISNLSLTGAAATGSTVNAPGTSNGGLTWSVPVTTGSTDGTLTLNLANATGLSAAISTSLPYAGQSYTIDKTAPTVLSVVRLSPTGQQTNNVSVVFRVTYSEPVALNAPTASRFAVMPVGGSTITGTVAGVSGTGDTRDVTVNLSGGTGEFRLRVLD